MNDRLPPVFSLPDGNNAAGTGTEKPGKKRNLQLKTGYDGLGNIAAQVVFYVYMIDAAGNPQEFKAGDVNFVDLNGDGIINEADKTIIGNPNPS